jgi:hypothetical protein
MYLDLKKGSYKRLGEFAKVDTKLKLDIAVSIFIPLIIKNNIANITFKVAEIFVECMF